MLDSVLQYLTEDHDRAVDRLRQFLSIPSVSTDPQYADGIRRGAQWVAEALTDIGLDTTIHPTQGHPIVVGTSPADGGRGTRVLYYGHYDVQPPDPLGEWASPPFEPIIRDGTIVARGASDDKGQICCILEALRAWKAVCGGPPVRVTVMIEGEEECGSVHLPDFVEQRQDELASDTDSALAVISDTTMWDTPSGSRVAITYGLRGMVYYDIQLHGPNRDLHSGVYGGAVANPANMLTQVLGRLFDDQHRITLDGFYDDVVPLSDDERQHWAHLHFDEKAFLEAVGLKQGFGESGYALLHRRWARPSCDVNGLYSGYGGAGSKTIIPSHAGAKVSFRLAPNQDPHRIGASFEQWIKSHRIAGCTWELTRLGQAWPVLMSTDSPYIAAAAHAVERTAGYQPVLVREGATIPVVADFQKKLGRDSLLIGFGRADDCIHAPNEKFDLACFELGCRTHAALLAELPTGNP